MNIETAHSWGPCWNPDGSVTFNLWAPAIASVSVDIDGRLRPMQAAGDGWHALTCMGLQSGATYLFCLPDGKRLPDPASRFQPQGVHGPSVLCDPGGYDWQHSDWKGRPWEEAVIYEIHIGTFTAEGTFTAVIDQLQRLADLGFTAIEIMPLAQFPGARGWGYDGVFQFAPHSTYGSPDDLRHLIDAAHGCGLMVFLDVVYNHFGPEGNALPSLAPDFFHTDDPTPWGQRIDFGRDAVRRYFIDNVLYWLGEFRLDGLRLDAVDQIRDTRKPHILQELSGVVRQHFGDRHIHLTTENPANGPDLLAETGEGGRLFAADWNDDFHHALHVAITGEGVGHYQPFADEPFVQMKRALAEGYLQLGHAILETDLPASKSLPPTAFVHFLQNHDQVGNRALGDRLHAGLDRRCGSVLAEILVLSPQIPLFFMGDDHLSNRPFHFFADYEGEIAEAIATNRPREAENFGGFPEGAGPQDVPCAVDPEAFLRSKIDWSDADRIEAREWATFIQALLRIRMRHIVPLLGHARGYAGRVVASADRAVFIDWTLADGAVLSLRANLSGNTERLDDSLTSRNDFATADDRLAPWSTRAFLSRQGPGQVIEIYDGSFPEAGREAGRETVGSGSARTLTCGRRKPFSF